jgi:Transposase DDE domain group 1
LCAFVDQGAPGTGEPLAMLLRAGNAGSNTATDHIAVLADALSQLPLQCGYRVGKKVLVRAVTAGGTHEFVRHLHARRLSYSVGFFVSDAAAAAVDLIPETAWTPAHDADGGVRDGALVAEATGVLDLSGWPPGMRVIVRKERPHPGAQLRLTDRDGLRLTAFATSTTRGQLPDLELRHRRRARCEDRIRAAKDTGLANLPLHGFKSKPHLVCDRATGLRADRLDADAGAGRSPRQPMGTQTTAAAAIFNRRTHCPSCPTNPSSRMAGRVWPRRRRASRSLPLLDSSRRKSFSFVVVDRHCHQGRQVSGSGRSTLPGRRSSGHRSARRR